ncbi:MAG: 5-formyltetrahydrofolate cyclo-ligase, partial [Roseicyclus sp.]
SPDPKARLRTEAFAARKAAFAGAAAHVPRATEALLAEIGPAAGRVVAGYMPIRTEIDPRPAMAALHAGGVRIAVPVIAGRGLPLDFREWTPGARLVEGPFGARIPETGDWLVPEILIVPLVAFDAGLNRLGYGGGFYDRTLARLRAGGPTRAIGFAFAGQEMPSVPAGPTDQTLDAVVTELGVRRP